MIPTFTYLRISPLQGLLKPSSGLCGTTKSMQTTLLSFPSANPAHVYDCALGSWTACAQTCVLGYQLSV